MLTTTSILTRNLCRISLNYFNSNFVGFTSSTKVYGKNGKSRNDEKKKKFDLPPVPQDCCMSGCANCVWMKYAEEIVKIVGDDGEVAKAIIQEHVKDPNLRTFLMMELNHLFKDKK